VVKAGILTATHHAQWIRRKVDAHQFVGASRRVLGCSLEVSLLNASNYPL
jgi:hypothetical protein